MTNDKNTSLIYEQVRSSEVASYGVASSAPVTCSCEQ